MNKNHETQLLGGSSAAEVVRIKRTVRRSMGINAAYSHKVLKLLEEQNFIYAPRFLGIDEKGREILTFIEGDVPHEKINWSHDQLIKIVQMIKYFHDITATSDLKEKKEVVCHNDIAPWNIVLKNNIPIAFIDFDDVSPGNRVDDLAYFLWTFLELGNEISADIQACKIRILCAMYGFSDGQVLISSLLQQQKKILKKRKILAKKSPDPKERKFSQERIKKIHSEIEWVNRNRKILENALD